MADHPDPTRRLRPLLEARAQRRTARSADGPEERIDAGPATDRADVTPFRYADEDVSEIPPARELAGGGAQLDRSDAANPGGGATHGGLDARSPRSDAPALAGVGSGVSGGWVPSWAGADEPDKPRAAGAVPLGPRRRMGAAPMREQVGSDRPGSRTGRHHRASGSLSRGGERRGRQADAHTDGDADVEIDGDAVVDLNGSPVGASDAESERSGAAEPVLLTGSNRGPWRPWTRWRERWVPEGPGVRVDPGRRGGAVISMIAAAAVVASALGFFRNEGTVVAPSTVAVVDGGPTSSISATLPLVDSPVQQPGDAAVGPPGAETSASASPSTTADIVVAVTGSVRQPGIVTLPTGSRVADAVAAAGGVLDGTDYTGLNLAARLADGDSVVVGGSGQGLWSTGSTTGSGAAPAAAVPGPVDLNAADQAALETLPGVGPVMAGNIIAWRDSNGGFRSVDQLQEITGIGPARFATLAPLVRVG